MARLGSKGCDVHGGFVQHIVMDCVRGMHTCLVQGLAMSTTDDPRRAVCRDAEKGNACVKRLRQGGAVIQGCGAGSANHRNRGPCGQRQAQGVVRRCAFIDAHPDVDVRVVVQGNDQRGVSGTGAHHRVPNTVFGQHCGQHGRGRVGAAHLHATKVRGGYGRKAGAKLWSLASVSNHSSSGTEPSTIPPPAKSTTPLSAHRAQRKLT